jgi:Ca-activated chloride channel homolog
MKKAQTVFLFIIALILSGPITQAQQDVKLNVIVTDASGQPIKDVSKEDFQILEDGVPQTISFFSKDEVPVSYCLVMDTSGSFTGDVLGQAVEMTKVLINNSRPTDETCLIRFIGSDRIEKLQEFTTNRKALFEGLDDLILDYGKSAIIDAVYIAVQHTAQYKSEEDLAHRLRAIILITDGKEMDSYYKKSQMLELLRKERVQVFAIGVAKGSKKTGGITSPDKKAVSFLSSLAEETGGRAFFPNSLPELLSLSKDLKSYLHNQYIVGYSSTNKDQKNYRTVKVAISVIAGRDRRIAITRAGYVPAAK